MRPRVVAALASVIAALSVLPLFAVSALRAAEHGYRLPLDDAWIHLRFAMNLVAGDGFAFNPDDWHAGATSPLWVLVLGGLSFLGGDPAAQAGAASAVAFVAASRHMTVYTTPGEAPW